MSFEMEGLDEWTKQLKDMSEEFEKDKENELMKIGLMTEREIKPFVDVDTGRLRASITTKLVDNNTAEVGTNVDYAKFVNDGHMLNSRFVPKSVLQDGAGQNWKKLNIDTAVESKVGATSYINETLKLPITDSRVKGFKTHPQYIRGKHFMEKGIQSAEPKIQEELHSWLEDFFKRFQEG